MLRNLPLSLGVITVFGLLEFISRASHARATDSDSPLPHWIWTTIEKMPSNAKNPEKTSVVFQRSFAVTLPVRPAMIQLAADFCHATVIVNERRLFKVEPYSQTIEVDITSAMVLGESTLRIEATPVAGPSAIAASLSLGIADESRIQTLVSDASWTYATLSNLAAGESKMKPIVSLGTVTPNFGKSVAVLLKWNQPRTMSNGDKPLPGNQQKKIDFGQPQVLRYLSFELQHRRKALG